MSRVHTSMPLLTIQTHAPRKRQQYPGSHTHQWLHTSIGKHAGEASKQKSTSPGIPSSLSASVPYDSTTCIIKAMQLVDSGRSLVFPGAFHLGSGM